MNNIMKSLTIILSLITGMVYCGVYITHPFTNYYETVYIDNGKHLLRADVRTKGEFVVADGTEIIGEYSFDASDNLTSVIIPDSVTNIMRNAFWGCFNLTNVVFGSGIREIGDKAFASSTQLVRINLPDSLETIGTGVFASTSLQRTINIGSGLRNVGRFAFAFDILSTNHLPNTSINISPDNKWLRFEDKKLVRKKEDEKE